VGPPAVRKECQHCATSAVVTLSSCRSESSDVEVGLPADPRRDQTDVLSKQKDVKDEEDDVLSKQNDAEDEEDDVL
jgi:hypothetical protein